MMVTSANMSEGKSTVALNLAYAQATSGNRVLIVDADLRRPSLHKKTGLKNAYGFSDYLSGNLEYTKIIQTHADQKGLYVMTAGHLSRDPTKLLASKKLATFLTHASEYFDQIIIDTPPVIGFADTLILASAVDGVLFIVDESNMDKDKIQNSLAQLSRIRKNILGFVVTKAKQDVLTNDYYKEYYASRNKKKGLFGRSKPDSKAA
jgi:capsular exopolysaccharide synthesis family protein